ncbi:acetylornithine deacetylase [Thalassovita sp.]|jgi:acetylornithine deacetylase|uniref:acetylornithine deacetylase n=1 Tax=Thalassovita sp. TaxID=1979401 RepID=UPI003B59E5F6
MSLTIDVLARLVAFDTVSARSNLCIIDFIEDFLADRGFRLQRIPDQTGEKSGLYAEIGPAGDGILLSAHTDVVPVEGQVWTRDPFSLTRDGDRLYGRGTTDMKGYVAAMLYAADLASKVQLSQPLKLVFSYDEEIGCVGIQNMIGQLAPLLGKPRACFVGEPTEMQVAVGHKGKAALRAICHGQTGHSALAPKFVNALHLATDMVSDLRGLQAWLQNHGAQDADYDIPYSTVHVGKLTSGTALNIVPDRAELTFEYRHLAADSSENILAKIHSAAEHICHRYRSAWPGVQIEIDRYNAYPGLDVAPTSQVVDTALTLANANGVTKVPFGTEAGFFAALGIPTVVCGPGSMERQGHKPDECIELSQLHSCEQMMQRIIDDLA